MAFPAANSRRIFNTVSNTNIPISPPDIRQARSLDHRDEGSFFDADHPATGVPFPRRSTIGLWLTRGWVRRIHGVDHSHNDIVGYFLAALTVFYGITLGLVAAGTWNTFAAANEKVDVEAQIVASLYRDAGSYAEPTRSELRGDLAGYLGNVLDVGWPLQRRGVVPSQSGAFLDRFQTHLMTAPSAGANGPLLQAEVFKQLNQLIETRRGRLNAVHSGLPAPIWVLVIAGGLLCISTTWFFDTRSYRMHFWMTVQTCALLGLIVFMIGILDNPFRGKVSVSDEPLRLVHEQLARSNPIGASPSPKVSTERRDNSDISTK